jgi:hypothetical protein
MQDWQWFWGQKSGGRMLEAGIKSIYYDVVDEMSEILVMCAHEQMNAVCAHVHWENAHFTYLKVLV